jgi:hypothetical protein
MLERADVYDEFGCAGALFIPPGATPSELKTLAALARMRGARNGRGSDYD